MSRHLTVRCLPETGEVRTIGTTLRYDPRDPFAVTADFHDLPHDVRWRFSRDLLVDGLRCPVGQGDVRVRPMREAHTAPGVVLELHSPDGAVTLVAPLEEVHAFVTAATDAVPAGCEAEHLDVDAVIAACGVLR